MNSVYWCLKLSRSISTPLWIAVISIRLPKLYRFYPPLGFIPAPPWTGYLRSTSVPFRDKKDETGFPSMCHQFPFAGLGPWWCWVDSVSTQDLQMGHGTCGRCALFLSIKLKPARITCSILNGTGNNVQWSSTKSPICSKVFFAVA